MTGPSMITELFAAVTVSIPRSLTTCPSASKTAPIESAS